MKHEERKRLLDMVQAAVEPLVREGGWDVERMEVVEEKNEPLLVTLILSYSPPSVGII